MQNQFLSTGYLREAQIVPNIIPVSRSTFFQWVRDGRFPKPVKLSPRVTVWRAADVSDWLENKGQQQSKAVH